MRRCCKDCLGRPRMRRRWVNFFARNWRRCRRSCWRRRGQWMIPTCCTRLTWCLPCNWDSQCCVPDPCAPRTQWTSCWPTFWTLLVVASPTTSSASPSLSAKVLTPTASSATSTGAWTTSLAIPTTTASSSSSGLSLLLLLVSPAVPSPNELSLSPTSSTAPSWQVFVQLLLVLQLSYSDIIQPLFLQFCIAAFLFWQNSATFVSVLCCSFLILTEFSSVVVVVVFIVQESCIP